MTVYKCPKCKSILQSYGPTEARVHATTCRCGGTYEALEVAGAIEATGPRAETPKGRFE